MLGGACSPTTNARGSWGGLNPMIGGRSRSSFQHSLVMSASGPLVPQVMHERRYCAKPISLLPGIYEQNSHVYPGNGSL